MKYKYSVCIYEKKKFFEWGYVASTFNLDWIIRDELYIKNEKNEPFEEERWIEHTERIKDFPLDKENFYMFSSLGNRPCVLATCESVNTTKEYTKKGLKKNKWN